VTRWVLRGTASDGDNPLIDDDRGCTVWDPPGFAPNGMLSGQRLPFALAYGVTGDFAIWQGGEPVDPAGEDLEQLHLQAVAYCALMGTAEGFPEQELDL
jgi:hypothetical protein